MDFKDIASAIEKFAPTIARSLLGDTAGMVVSVLESFLGVDRSNILNYVLSSPDAAEKLAQLEKIYEIQSHQPDKESARGREEQITQILGMRDWVLYIIAIIVLIGFFTMCIIIAVVKQDVSDHDILNMLIGQITAAFVMVVSYFFGSSNKV